VPRLAGSLVKVTLLLKMQGLWTLLPVQGEAEKWAQALELL
jgi:hypothetical protein